VLDNGSQIVTLVIFEGNVASEAVGLRSGFSLRQRATAEHQGLSIATTVWERTG